MVDGGEGSNGGGRAGGASPVKKSGGSMFVGNADGAVLSMGDAVWPRMWPAAAPPAPSSVAARGAGDSAAVSANVTSATAEQGGGGREGGCEGNSSVAGCTGVDTAASVDKLVAGGAVGRPRAVVAAARRVAAGSEMVRPAGGEDETSERAVVGLGRSESSDGSNESSWRRAVRG